MLAACWSAALFVPASEAWRQLDNSTPDSEETELEHKSARQVAERCLAIIAVVSRAHEAPSEEVRDWLDQHDLTECLSPAEQAFVDKRDLTHEEVVDFSWRAEALAALLWALGGIPTLMPLNVQIDLDGNPLLEVIASDPAEFIRDAQLRPAEELDEAEADLYHQHWRVRDAQLFGKPMPAELDPGIVYQRRYALSWVVGWGENWDDVPTDT
jgi:hypothetical protein